jgi:adenylate cyclase
LFLTSADSGPEEAMRRSLERCGYVSNAACLVVALDDTFVAAVPTSARAVGFYRQDALFALQSGERAEVARRLATSNQGWQALALGATGHAGTEVGAVSERSAIDSAMEECAKHDHDCHVAVIGPFLVDPPRAPPAQPVQQR